MVSRQSNVLGRTSSEKIVLAAQDVLKTNGYSGLSTRKVAEKCGISVGNLTYHFPNKELLMEAVMVAVCDHYKNQRINYNTDKYKDPESYIRTLASWLFEDAVKPETSSLFMELWVMAKHNEFGAKILERFYTTVIGWISDGLKPYYPNATDKDRERAAYFLLTLSEGSVALYSRPNPRLVSQKDIVDFAVSGVLAILDKTKTSS